VPAVGGDPGLDGDDQARAERREDDGDVPEADGAIELVGGEGIGEGGVPFRTSRIGA